MKFKTIKDFKKELKEQGQNYLYCENCENAGHKSIMTNHGRSLESDGTVFVVYMCDRCLHTLRFIDESKKFPPRSPNGDGQIIYKGH